MALASSAPVDDERLVPGLRAPEYATKYVRA
jgi:hypothetical protein